jgi:hypothetical protein
MSENFRKWLRLLAQLADEPLKLSRARTSCCLFSHNAGMGCAR